MASKTTAAPAAETPTAPAVDTLSSILAASGATDEMGVFSGDEAAVAALATQTDEMTKAAVELGRSEIKRLPRIKLLVEGLARFATSVLREAPKGDKSIGPDWGRESGLCRSFYSLTITAPMTAAKIPADVQESIGQSIRDQFRNTYREKMIRDWVKDQFPDASDEATNAEIQRQYARFGLKAPGGSRAPKGEAGPKGNLANPGATLETAVAAVAASDVTIAPALIMGQIISLYSGLVTRYVEGKGTVEGWTDAAPLIDTLYDAVAALHKRQHTGEGDFAALLAPLSK